MSQAKARLLIVDDKAVVAETFRFLLSREGYEIVMALSGTDGLEFLQRNDQNFDLILSDLRMPDISGLELLAEARHCRPRTPFVLYTGFGSSAIEAAAAILGANDYLTGTWDRETLLALVQRNIERAVDGHAGPRAPIGPATRRWLEAVRAVMRAPEDIPTLSCWAKERGASIATLKKICSACGVRAGDSLDFGRALRVVIRHHGERCNYQDVLDIAETKTLAGFIDRAGFSKYEAVPDFAAFIPRQRFIPVPSLLDTVRRTLLLDRLPLAP